MHNDNHDDGNPDCTCGYCYPGLGAHLPYWHGKPLGSQYAGPLPPLVDPQHEGLVYGRPGEEDRLPTGRSTEALLGEIRSLVGQVPDDALRRVILSICAELDGSED